MKVQRNELIKILDKKVEVI
jgi:uncharacterized membrane protein YcgQ (UPF0703/DUF1980 family)